MPPIDRPPPAAALTGRPDLAEPAAEESTESPREDGHDAPSRRRFLQLMGASLALGNAAGGCRWEREESLPLPQRPPGTLPGAVQHFATAMDLYGTATGLLVTSYEGRPIKIEGNPLHPDSGGATNVFQQASLLGLYDPDRSSRPLWRGPRARLPSDWPAFERFLTETLTRHRGDRGRGMAILTAQHSSPSRRDLRARIAAVYPAARWHEWEPCTRDAERAGTTLAFGRPYRALARLDQTRVLLCLDADPLVQHPGGLTQARALMRARDPEATAMARVYAVESAFSAAGVAADHRLPLRSELVLPLAMALDAAISARAQALPEHGSAQPHPDATFLREPHLVGFLTAVTEDLLAHVGHGLVLAGPQQPPSVHAIAHRLNVLLGNVGTTVDYLTEAEPERPTHLESIQALTRALTGDEIETLFILENNPVYDAPVDLDFAAALARAKVSVHLGLTDDETGARCTWHLPAAHFLESWGDGLAQDGTLTLVQPLIAPLFGGRSSLELLAALVGDGLTDGLSIVRRTHRAHLAEDRRWSRAVQQGMVPGSSPHERPTLRPLPPASLTERQRGGLELENGALELTFHADARVHDGRFANNGWLQELPEPITKLTWENAALLAPGTAEHLGIADGTLVRLQLDGRTLELPALQVPGQAPGSVRVALGSGRTRAGLVGGAPERGVAPAGADAYRLRTTSGLYIATGLSITAVRGAARLAITQPTRPADPLGHRGEAARLPSLARRATRAQLADPTYSARDGDHPPPQTNLRSEPTTADSPRWGMTIDLGRCLGCNACVVACTAENNVPIVGKDQVHRGREMHWLRLDRHFCGAPEAPEIVYLPVACQHCENAPCEQVCPVGATLHSSEGLNDMVYNRCVGTRYCSNNCPYKVRRYNYYHYSLGYRATERQTQRLVLNPEVTVRSRGVMEKCSFCVQRIQHAKIAAKNAGRELRDEELVTACQQACPTAAIVFGDLSNPKGRATTLRQSRRTYELLAELNNRPRVSYLAGVKNPHPALQLPVSPSPRSPAAAARPPRERG